ncbi:hypothetical protein BCV72DRAFT_204419 [Rhizopus microsporus var. microsporus]|uniref:Myosin motor domain-containing protein n=1 Tax=Rhizopus microsporus var. microsporus TaxID=86635 RepID=A0A1X0R7U5_RHIZD|nr:hypothetical protein BCV72DRAFT_204419 [Rhizopus microsporus var. microsporus]
MITTINQSGTILHSHGIEVYHKHTPLAASDHDAGFNLQKWAWIEQKDSPEAFVKVRVVDDKSFNDMVLVEYEDGYKVRIQINKVYMMNPPKLDQVEDMAELLYLHEAAVVHNLTQRYRQNNIYTYSGLFLVAVNPYRNLPIYSSEIIKHYRKKRRGEAPPHIYAIADHAFYNMLHEKENQSILITGESGAGKTENTKIVIQYLATIAGNGSNGFTSDKPSKLEEQILQANPILEAFGNAQTIRNNNSSRFGKFIRIIFNRNGDIRGTFIDWYLLETSRVHTQTLEERNYHIFYQLLSANQDMKATLHIDQKCPADFNYTKNSNHTIQGVDDAAEYNKLVQSMDIMGITFEERLNFFRIVVAILYLGNIVVSNHFGRVDITNYELACEILGVSPLLFKKHLMEPQIRAGNEWVSQSKSPSQVKDHLDALTKVLYERNFGHLVSRINMAIDGPRSLEGMLASEGERFIGVLDIAGFEIFKINSFEQLCINYTNEKLQDFFNQNMFVLEENEYKKENIQCDDSFDYRNDLQPTIDLIESAKNPIGILSCLEDECVTQGTDERLLSKIVEQNASNPRFKRDIYNEGFTIRHYAGDVKYSTSGWIERGKDPLNEHIARLFSESTNPHVATLFKDYANTSANNTPRTAVEVRKALFKTRKGGGNFHTVGYKHKQQLSVLMNILNNTHPHFVRCILPNDRKRPGEIQPQLVLHQLRCNGVLEGIRICRIGYPNRLTFQQFREQYKLIAPELVSNERDHRKACMLILDSVPNLLNTTHYQLGKTKVFFKAGILGELEKQRDLKLSEIVTKIQAACLGLIARRRAVLRQSQDQLIRTIQRNARVYVSMQKSKLWKVYFRRKDLQYTFGAENAIQKKVEDLEQKQESEVQHWQAAYHQMEEEKSSWISKNKQLEQELEETKEAFSISQRELFEARQLSEEQAVMLSKIHQDIQEECEENESLMVQCDELCRENQELQEKIQHLEEDKGASEELQEELNEKVREFEQLQQVIEENESKYSQEIAVRDEKIFTLNEKITVRDKALKSLEASLEKEREERRSYQMKCMQMEQNVNKLRRLLENEARESRSRAER